MAEELGYYEGKLRQVRKLQQELNERVAMLVEDCDEFWANDIDLWSDNTSIAYEDDAIYVSWSTWGCKVPYAYLDRDIYELNEEHFERQKQKTANKLRRQREEKRQRELEVIEQEKAELKRLRAKYPDEF